MNVTPINNNRNNLAFGNIYKVRVNPEMLKGVDGITEKADAFSDQVKNMMCQLKDFRLNTQEGSLFNQIRNIPRLVNGFSSSCVLESFKYNTFKILQKNSNLDLSWLANHLGIEEPKPLDNAFHSFLVYTGDENIAMRKALETKSLKKIDDNINAVIDKKCQEGKLREIDREYWKQIGLSVRLDEISEVLAKKKGVEDVTINNVEDFANFGNKVSDDIVTY